MKLLIILNKKLQCITKRKYFKYYCDIYSLENIFIKIHVSLLRTNLQFYEMQKKIISVTVDTDNLKKLDSKYGFLCSRSKLVDVAICMFMDANVSDIDLIKNVRRLSQT